MKTVAILASTAATLALSNLASMPVNAREHPREHSGYCPPGTCAEYSGGPWARNVNNCKASHCKKADGQNK